MSTEIICAKCKTPIHPLEVFPGTICLECHAAKTANQTPAQMYQSIMTGFGPK